MSTQQWQEFKEAMMNICEEYSPHALNTKTGNVAHVLTGQGTGFTAQRLPTKMESNGTMGNN